MIGPTDIKRIDEAIDALSEVTGVEREDLRKALKERYSSLEDVLGEKEGNGNVKKTLLAMGRRLKVGASRAGKAVNEKVHTNPWPFIAGAAASSLIVGFLVGRRLYNHPAAAPAPTPEHKVA
jgi:ElaB/YqjD/DUF883 family membrane-anchored ribosome-binding protein